MRSCKNVQSPSSPAAASLTRHTRVASVHFAPCRHLLTQTCVTLLTMENITGPESCWRQVRACLIPSVVCPGEAGRRCQASRRVQRKDYNAKSMRQPYSVLVSSIAAARRDRLRCTRPATWEGQRWCACFSQRTCSNWTWSRPTMDSRRSCQPAAQTSGTEAPLARMTGSTVQSAYGCCSMLAHRSTLSSGTIQTKAIELDGSSSHWRTGPSSCSCTLSMQPSVQET